MPLSNVRTANKRVLEVRRLVVPGAGHWVQRDQPAVVTTVVLRFLDELG